MSIGDKTIQNLDKTLIENLQSELRLQGHYLTGSLENSMKSTKEKNGDKIVLEITAAQYINPVDEGVPASRIPYNPNVKSGATTSKYIEGLKNYAKLRFGLTNDKEALSAAFAIAKKHAREGMPTSGSYAFSDNGRRKKSISESFNDNENEIEAYVDIGLNSEVDDFINKVFDKTVF